MDPPYPYALDIMYFEQAGFLDRLCIVRAEEAHQAGRMKDGETGDASTVTLSVERGTVVDGPGKGGTIRLVAYDAIPEPLPPGTTQGGFSGIRHSRRPAFLVGWNYLALAAEPRDHVLYVPYSVDEARFLKQGGYVFPNVPSEAFLFNAFPTDATRLPDAKDPSARLLNALVDALPAVHGWDRDRLIKFLSFSGGLGYSDSGTHPDSAITRRLRAMAKAATDPILRVDALTVLMNWHIMGTEGPFFDALMEVADLPGFGGELPSTAFFTSPGWDGVPSDYRLTYGFARARALASSARNGLVRRYLFEHAIVDPTPADKARYARQMDREPREFVDRVMLKRFAEWDGENDKEPVLKTPPGKFYGEAENHAALVTYWQAKYKG